MKNENKEFTTLTFRLSVHLKNKVKKFSIDEGDSMANVIIKAIHSYLAKK